MYESHWESLTHCLSPLPTHTHEQHNPQWGGTALYLAAQEEHEDIVDLLLGANADPDVPVKVIHAYHTLHMWTVPNMN